MQPSAGNPPPRIVETPSGMLNAIGLQNVGLEEFVAKKLPFLRQFRTPVIVNCYGKSIEEYRELCRRLSAVEGIAGLEVNISCPNVKEGGICFGTDPRQAHALVRAVRAATALPLIVKLSPNVTDIALIARSVEEAGADALSVTNTFTGMVIDIETCRPVLANITGGLSGPCDQAPVPADGLGNGTSCFHPGNRAGRNHDGSRCPAVSYCRRPGNPGRHGPAGESRCAAAHYCRHRRISAGTQHFRGYRYYRVP